MHTPRVYAQIMPRAYTKNHKNRAKLIIIVGVWVEGRNATITDDCFVKPFMLDCPKECLILRTINAYFFADFKFC